MTFRTLLLAGATATVLAPPADAHDLRGAYFAIEGGAGWVESENLLRALFFTADGSTSTGAAASFDGGWALIGSVGHAFSSGLRAELEIGYRSNGIDTLITSGALAVAPAGDLDQFTLMANLAYDIALTDRLSATFGAGIGVDRAALEIAAWGLDEADWTFAYQAVVGLTYEVGGGVRLLLNYRYLNAQSPDYTNFVTLPAPATQRLAFLGNLDSHALTLGLRFGLSDDVAPAPPPPPPAAPPAPSTPRADTIPRQFTVFFGFNRFDLTDEAIRVVGDAADAAARTGTAALRLVGHADSSGAPRQNTRLSQRRAAAVRAELLRLGVPAAKIFASGKGESELVVRTTDGVQEPQNRRVIIDLE